MPLARPVVTMPGSDRPTACLMTWQGETWLADPGEVRDDAADLIECAIAARLLGVLLAKIGMPGHAAAGMVADVMARPGRKQFGSAATVIAQPVGSSADKQAWVRVTRGDLAADLGSDVTYALGRHWLEVAEAVDSDRLLVAALRGLQPPDGFEALLMAEVIRRRTEPDPAG